MLISPFTPLFFISRKSDGLDSGYTQVFATADRILIEIFVTPEEESPDVTLYDGQNRMALNLNRWEMNPTVILYFSVLSLPPGIYTVKINGIGECRPFFVTDDARIIRDTTLIQYSNMDNRQRDDAVFVIAGMPYFFDFRVHGGFKDSGWSFGVESEQFVTSDSDIVQLYARESTQKQFTLGTSSGVPVWFGEHLNRLLTCTHVYFDGVKYCRKESDVPELTIQLDGVNSFVFTQRLQQSVNLDPRLELTAQMLTRRVDDNDHRLLPDDTLRLIYP